MMAAVEISESVQQALDDLVGFLPNLSPSALIGRVVFWFIFLGALSIAISALGITALNDFLADVFAYLPNIVAAILIFIVATAVAGVLPRVIARPVGGRSSGSGCVPSDRQTAKPASSRQGARAARESSLRGGRGSDRDRRAAKPITPRHDEPVTNRKYEGALRNSRRARTAGRTIYQDRTGRTSTRTARCSTRSGNARRSFRSASHRNGGQR